MSDIAVGQNTFKLINCKTFALKSMLKARLFVPSMPLKCFCRPLKLNPHGTTEKKLFLNVHGFFAARRDRLFLAPPRRQFTHRKNVQCPSPLRPHIPKNRRLFQYHHISYCLLNLFSLLMRTAFC